MDEVPAELPAPTAEGTFARTPFVQVLVYVLERSLTGTIEIIHPGGPWASILVLEGQPAKGRTSEPVAYLGSVLHQLGYIDDSSLNSSLGRMATERKLHGQILLEMGKITPDQLSDGLRAQLVQKIEHLFDWPPETHFAYYDGFDALHAYGADDPILFDSAPIVWTAIRTHPPWEHVHAALTRVGPNALRITASAQLERFEFNKEERAAADLLRVTPMRVHELVATKLLSAATAQLLAYCLLITKQVELIAAAKVEPKEEAPASALGKMQLAQVAQPPRPAAVEQKAMFTADPRASVPSPAYSSSPILAVPAIPPAPALPGATTRPKPADKAAETGRSLPPPLREPPPPPPLAPQHEARKSEILLRLKSIKSEDYFQMLGVSQEATTEQIQSAFLPLAKAWHPDRLPVALHEVREACATIFSHMSEAHQTLMDPQRRAQYMHLLKDGGATPDEQEQVQAVLEAATNFQKAEFFLRRGDLREAEALCRKALDADPKPAEYLAMRAWLEALKPENQAPKPTADRIAMLDAAIAANERLERAYFYRGMLYKRLGNHHAATRDFRQAAELNPRNLDAVREVRLYEMRKNRGSLPPPPPADDKGRVSTRPSPRPPPPARPEGLFGKLFKK
jgi:tetratricopeptide (TPR) repeat protein